MAIIKEMALFLEITKGANVGERTPLTPGLSIGRHGDIVLKDSKVSGKHALVIARNDALFLQDNNSANGIWLGRKKVKELRLESGTEFRIGKTHLAVIELSLPALTSGEPVTEKVAKAEEADTEIPPPPPPSPREQIKALLKDLAFRFPQIDRKILAFNPCLHLHFIQGRQTQTEWVIGYGPRSIGVDCYPLRLEEPDAPSTSFVLRPLGYGAEFSTDSPELVQINGEKIATTPLEEGDIICIGDTKIRVSFIDGSKK